VELLQTLAHLAPEEIPRFALSAPSHTGDNVAHTELVLDRQLGALRRYSMVRVDGDGIFVHRLLQAVVRDRLSADERAAIAARTLGLVERAFPRSGAYGRARPECTQLLPHAVTAISHARHVPACRIDMARLLTRTGVYVAAVGWSAEAVKHLDRAIEIFAQAGPEHVAELAQASDALGMILYQMRRLEPAAECHAQAISIFARGAHRDPARAAQASINLAWVRWSDGKLAAAEDAASSALELLGSEIDPLHVRAIGGLSILARILYDRGNLDEARARVREVDGWLHELPPQLHPLMCGPLLQVAHTLHAFGQPFAALGWAAKGLELGEKAYGRQHPLVAGTHCVLGQVHHALGNLEQALVHLRAAVENAEAAPQVDQHIAVAACFASAVLLDLRRPAEAREAVATAERLLGKTLGARRQMEARVALARGRLELLDGRTDVALRQFEHASASFATDGGPQHPALIEALTLHGDTGLARGDRPGALAAYEAALQVAERHHLSDHPLVAAIHLGLAELHETHGDRTAAGHHRERAGEISTATLAGPSAFPERVLGARVDALRRRGAA
jgi:tetratricopeptide (TPR) repeat protein